MIDNSAEQEMDVRCGGEAPINQAAEQSELPPYILARSTPVHVTL